MRSSGTEGPSNVGSGREILSRAVGERCDGCGAERPQGSEAFCRCQSPAWRSFCTRCLKPAEAGSCAHCLGVAEANGRKLRAVLDETLARLGGLAGATAAATRTVARAESALREFGLAAVAAPLEPWAARLSDKAIPLPPGAEHSRVKMQAINELRLEDAAVRVALSDLGYTGAPTDDKLAKTAASVQGFLAPLAAWDGLAAGAEHEHALRSTAASLVNAVATTESLVETIRRRDLSRLVTASVRRQRAVRNCQTALGVG